MEFLELYGDALDMELGSADRTNRFTTAKRKLAINEAQTEWIRVTGSFTRTASHGVLADTQEYDLQVLIGDDMFMRLAKRQPYFSMNDGSDTTYLEGDSFQRFYIEDLDRDEPGWRDAPAGQPKGFYIREEGEAFYIGLHPTPNEPVGSTWVLHVPYVAYADDMVDDADVPFEGAMRLRAYHRALVHYAAYLLEKLRRNYSVAQQQHAAFLAWTQEYLGDNANPAGDRVSYDHNYFSAAGRSGSDAVDPRRFP